MIKVKCALPFCSQDIGYALLPNETEDEARMRITKENPHKELRPCAKYQGWVFKSETCNGCKYCIEIYGK